MDKNRKLSLQVLISTMNQSDYSLLEKMNIQSDAIVVNQCNYNAIKEFEFRGHHIKWYSINERGVGLSRNTALMRATADIVLFADDDVVYKDNYSDVIIQTFEKYPLAGLIAFNLPSENLTRKEKIVNKAKKLNLFNCLKFGAFRIAVRRNIIFEKRVYFSLLFGGGAKYSAGEDNLFVSDCIKKFIKCYCVPEIIGSVKHESSTWFKGYNEKYFIDKGILMYEIYGHLAYFFSPLICIKNKKLYSNINIKNAVLKTWEGIREIRYIK